MISVIVPIYNVEKYLDRCITSIISQTYKDLEIILVDDGSTDTSGEICDRYASEDSRIVVIHKQNGGLSDARNAGLVRATGDYIGYVDGDDWIEPDMYELMVTNCMSAGADVAACRYKEVYPDRCVDGSTDMIKTLSKEETLEIYLCGDAQVKIYNSVWSKLFKKELVKDYRFPVGQKSEDIMYTTKAFCNMNKCVYIDKALYNYVRGRVGSIMESYDEERMFKDELPFFKEQIDYIRGCGMEEYADKAAYHFYRRLLMYFLDCRKDAIMRGTSRKLSELVKAERNEVKRVYKLPFVSTGDKARMRIMLCSPELYYWFAVLYEEIIVRIKRKSCRD